MLTLALEVAMVQPDELRSAVVEVQHTVVELRVHGVSGTPPEELLDRPMVRQVAGDKTAGFYRPRLREEWRDRPSYDRGTDSTPYSTADESHPPPLLEGYSWGGLTSGSPSRALWLVLLPFTLINVAPRMRPVPGETPDDAPKSAWTVWFLSRVMAVSLTVTLTLGALGISLATLAWQCADACPNLPWPLSAMFVHASAGWRVLWGTVFPLLVLSFLALLSWRKSVQYDLIRPTEMDKPVTDPTELGSTAEPRLGDPSFWYGRFPVSRLRHVHLQAGVAVVGFSLVLAAQPSVPRSVGIIVAAVTGALLLAGLAWPGLLRRSDIVGPAAERSMVKAANIGWILLIWLPVLVLLVLGLSLPHGANGEMAGYGGVLAFWFAGQSIVTLIMLVLVGGMSISEKRRTPRRAMWGLGSVVMTILALYLGAAMTSGLVILSAAWITSSSLWISIGDVEALLQPDSPIIIPDSLKYAGLGTFLVTVVLVVIALITASYAAVMLARGGSAADKRHAREAADDALIGRPDERTGMINRRRASISRSFWIARRGDYLAGYLAVFVLIIGVVGSAYTVLYSIGVRRGPEDLATLANNPLLASLGIDRVDPVAVGEWLIGILVATLVVLGALAYRVPRTRKAVGILWDLGSFWPRDVHPLAPPCYAERAVPELGRRLVEHVDMVARQPADADGASAPSGLVVLAGHSQGTVISMAALLGPGRQAAERTALLTFGTVLRRVYARLFPLYFSTGAFEAVARRLGQPDLPVTGQQVTDQPVADKHVTDQSVSDRPVSDRPVSDQQVTDQPVTGKQSADLSPPTDPWGVVDAGLFSSELRWRNLWRRSDYIGGRMGDPLADSVPAPRAAGQVQLDVEFTDPQFLPGRGDSTMPAAGRHSDFPRDPEFQAVLMSLVHASFAALERSGEPTTAVPPPPVPRAGASAADDLMNPRESM